MKRGAAPKFKELGSSPAKQVKGNYPKGFNYMGDNWPDKTPGYKDTKATKTKMATDFNLENKKAQNVKLTKVKKPTSILGRVTKALKDTPKQLAKGAKEILKTAGKTARLGVKGSVVGGLATEALIGFHKSGQKHSGGKAWKGQKTGVVTPKKSIYKK